MLMKLIGVSLSLLLSIVTSAQLDLKTPFKECRLKGSITIYDHQNHKWIFSDEADAAMETLPASTFKVINLLIALETGVIKDENEIVKWVPGSIDTALYGHRTGIYHDMSVQKAFEISAGWVFIELAKRVGKEKYQKYLTASAYGNQNYRSEKGVDFWNLGSFGISPKTRWSF
jgi:beta-lactamase class D